MRLAAQRYIGDRLRARQPNAPFYFDEWEACNPCDFIEKLPHVEGTWDSDTIQLHESDVFFIINLFGFRNQNGTRRFTTALKAVARKNAKSTIAAGIGLYCETCEGEKGPQVISGATTGAQARIIFNIAKRMVDKTPDLREEFKMEAFANSIACYKNGGFFKPINSKASSQDGLNPSCTLVDEIHAHKTHDLINVLRSAAGARGNPLLLYTTTEGYEWPGPWMEIRHFAKQVLLGLISADHFLVVYYALDDQEGKEGDADYKPADDDFDEHCWGKANPLMDVNPLLLKEIRKEAIEAKQMPGRLAEFRIKRLNRQSSTSGGWVNLTKLRANTEKVDLEMLRRHPCYGGLDLASTSDLCSFRLVWNLEGRIYTIGWRYVPKAAVRFRTDRGLVPYVAWVASQHLIEAGDEVTDYDVIQTQIEKAHSEFNIIAIGFDGWNARQLCNKLTKKNVPMVEFIQGPKSYHPAMKEFEIAYIKGNFIYDSDPVLNWCASNMVSRFDQNMNLAPDKQKSMDKIDDLVATLMGIGVSLKEPEPKKKFQAFFA